MELKDVMKNLNGMDVTDNFINDVVCAFEDYVFEGCTFVQVTRDESNTNVDYQAYIDHPNSPIICIKIENNMIVKAYEA